MRKLTNKLIPALAVFLTVGLTVACGDDPAPGDDDREEQEEQDPPGEGAITHVDSEDCSPQKSLCTMGKSIGVEVPLEARVVDETDQPVEDVVVSYKVTEGKGNVTFAGGSKSALTKSGGVATATIQTAEEAGEATIEASTNDDSLGTVKWKISISPKGGLAYEVNVSYEGEAELGDGEVKLFPGNKSCDELISDFSIRRTPDYDPSALPSPVGSIPPRDGPLQLVEENKFEGSYIFNQTIEKGKKYTVWAVGYKVEDENVDEPKVELAYGCAEGDKLNSPEPVEVDVELQSHIPVLDKEYTVVNKFDMVGALPDGVERFVRLFGLLLKSPGSFLVGCKPGDTDIDGKEICPEEQGGQVKGLVDIVVENLGDGSVSGTIKEFLKAINEGTIARSTVRELVDSFVVDKLIGSNGATETIHEVSEDIYDSLTRFSTRGTIRFEDQPTPMLVDGKPVVTIPVGGGNQHWKQIQFFWRYKQGCEEAQDPESCRTQWFNIDNIMPEGEKIVKGELGKTEAGDPPHGAVMEGGNDLDISKHDLSLNFGALALGTIENVVLPRYFSDAANNGDAPITNLDTKPERENGGNGNGVVTLNEVLQGTLADCDGIAGQFDGNVQSAVKKACNDIVDSLVMRVEEWLFEALEIKGDTLTIETSPGEPCTLHQPDVYPDSWGVQPLPKIESLGKDKDGERCQWDMKFSFAPDPIKGNFYTE